MRSGRLLYEHISAVLTKLGFKVNPDELSVWNKDVNGKQMTVVLYVDDLKESHHDGNELLALVTELEMTYGRLEPNKERVFDYCRMTVDYRTKGVCKLSTTKYIKTAI